jgi:hypothetical protein
LRIEGVLVYSFAIERYINFKFCDTTRVGPKRATARAGTTPLSGSPIGGWGGGREEGDEGDGDSGEAGGDARCWRISVNSDSGVDVAKSMLGFGGFLHWP